jgi:hypothetical protein
VDTEYLKMECGGSLSDYYTKMGQMFPGVMVGTPEAEALSALGPTPEDVCPGQVPYNKITTVRELIRGGNGDFLIELGTSTEMLALRGKMRKTALTGVEKLTLEQARAMLDISEPFEPILTGGKEVV